MIEIRGFLLAAVLAPLLAACAGPDTREARRTELARRVESVLRRPELRGTTAGIEFRRVSGELLYERGSDLVLPAASTTKVVTCAGALALLGKDFRFRTRVVRTGEVHNGTLQGDLVLVASGDPNLSQRVGPGDELLFVDNDHTYADFVADAKLVPGDPLAVIGSLADRVGASGIRKVEGAVIVDDGLFRDADDAPLENLSAVCVNDNSVDVVVTPAAEAGKPPTIRVQPEDPSIVVENRAMTVDAEPADTSEGPLRVEHRGGIGRFELTGAIPRGKPPFLCVGRLPRPALAAAAFLVSELGRRGIEVRDAPRRASSGPAAYAGLPTVAEHVSPPLAEALKVVLKVSHNLHAEMLPLLVGATCAGEGTRRAGYRLIRDLFRREGLDVERVVLQTGSGLGRADCLTARFLVAALRRIASWKDAGVFYAALPLGGVNGTLASHCRSPRLRGRVRAKTGTLVYPATWSEAWIYTSKSLAGYLELDRGRPPADPRRSGGPAGDDAVFAILLADTVGPSRREVSEALFRAQEDILEAVAEVYGRP